jgi:hypothetical protein
MSEPLCINPSEESLEHLFIDEQGYNCFSICKTSNVDTRQDSYKRVRQKARYQIYALFSEKIGIIQCDEFYVSHDQIRTEIQAIGKK